MTRRLLALLCWALPLRLCRPLPLTPADFRVRGLEALGCLGVWTQRPLISLSASATDETYAGFMPLSLEENANREGSYFFWLAMRRGSESSTSGKSSDGRDRLVVWLNGGPGCSSMVGMMWENGPFTIAEGGERKFSLVRNAFAWNEAAHVLFVEQPLRTGFSPAAEGSRRVKDETVVAADFHRFLQSFLRVFNSLASLPLFITGESYAGTYIPWMAEHILRAQAQPSSLPRDAVQVNLQGVAIGNGEIDFVTQEASFAEYAYGHGLIPLTAKQHFERLYQLCLQSIESAGRVSRGAFGRCSIMSLVLEAAGRPNEYNTNTFASCDFISDPGNLFHRFLNDPDVHTRTESPRNQLPARSETHGEFPRQRVLVRAGSLESLQRQDQQRHGGRPPHLRRAGDSVHLRTHQVTHLPIAML